MKEYLRERKRIEDKSKVTGIVLTVLLHAAALCVVSFSGLKYIWPPPEESSFLVDYTEREEVEIDPIFGREPQGEEVDLEKDVELVQKSESPNQSLAENLTPATKPDDFGDVETPRHPITPARHLPISVQARPPATPAPPRLRARRMPTWRAAR